MLFRSTAACRFTDGGRLEVRLGDEVAGGEGALYYMYTGKIYLGDIGVSIEKLLMK